MSTQTILISLCIVILVYIAIIITLSFTIGDMRNIFDQSLKLDSELYNRLSTGANYIYQTDTGKSMQTTLLNGQNFSQNEFLLMYDSTPYASKGHVAMTLPCNEDEPALPTFQVLAGRAPDLFPLPLGYIQNISSVPNMCVFHGQFGFGDPVSDLALRYVGEGNMTLNGPYSVIVSSLESYIPKQKSFEELQHAQMGTQ
ncbi:MAG: hypothetical protein H0X50_09385 [Nitrosopumilus sp.]|nr:hypothetical protein [Nitrosopumilus sp.]